MLDRPIGTDLAAAYQVRERGERLLDVGDGCGTRDLVEVDVVGLQAAQQFSTAVMIQRREVPCRLESSPIGRLNGREDDAVTTPFERLAHDLFGVAVGVGGVDEVDARVQRLVDDADRVVVVGVADGRGATSVCRARRG